MPFLYVTVGQGIFLSAVAGLSGLPFVLGGLTMDLESFPAWARWVRVGVVLMGLAVTAGLCVLFFSTGGHWGGTMVPGG